MMRRGNIPMREDTCEKIITYGCVSVSVNECVCGRVCTSTCVIALTFHCHELVLIVVTAANYTVR